MPVTWRALASTLIMMIRSNHILLRAEGVFRECADAWLGDHRTWPDRRLADRPRDHVSRDRARAEEFARVHGAATALDDYAKMLADPAVDAVYIATPNALHADQVIAAALAGKHVLCDK